jgi:transcription elongation factor GreA
MTYDTTTRSPGSALLSRTDLDAAVRELESLRSAHRADVAERLRDARTYGAPGDDEDHLDDAAFGEMRIAQLERLIASATLVEGATADGLVGLGSVVRVRDQSGRETEYEIVGRRLGGAARTQVTPASPVGEALIGARSGDRVRVVLPSGGRRTLTVMAVSGPEPGERSVVWPQGCGARGSDVHPGPHGRSDENRGSSDS